ncbi:MAG TPA: c-type cytochrome [Bryobacteraceae bacterium]|nr:c-type cytochrome [Bryobacteraceae bacterium]
MNLTRPSIALFAALIVASPAANAQGKQDGKGGSDSLTEHGRYIVENVAMCELCHTPRDDKGNPDRGRWLMGGPVQLRPSYPAPNWAQTAPRIGGGPPGTDSDFIKLLTTGIARTGRPPDPPMPPFRMTRADAEAVLAYLKSLAVRDSTR